MPIYEYCCRKCNSCFSLLQRIGATEKDTQCPACGAKDVKKMVSFFSSPSSGSSVPYTSSMGGSGGS